MGVTSHMESTDTEQCGSGVAVTVGGRHKPYDL